MCDYFVYIMTNKRNGTLYVGVTNDLARRVWEHKEKNIPGFTKKYELKNLVYLETYATATEAIHREKCIKEWKRRWKLELIESINPDWEDLYEKINM